MSLPSEITVIPANSTLEQGVIHFQDGAGVCLTELLKVADTESNAKLGATNQLGLSDTISKSCLTDIKADI
jgi:hypothetical protein